MACVYRALQRSNLRGVQIPNISFHFLLVYTWLQIVPCQSPGQQSAYLLLYHELRTMHYSLGTDVRLLTAPYQSDNCQLMIVTGCLHLWSADIRHLCSPSDIDMAGRQEFRGGRDAAMELCATSQTSTTRCPLAQVLATTQMFFCFV